MPETRDFHIAAILTILTDIMVDPAGPGGVYQILDWMTGDSLFTHQLPRAADECAPALREQHPDLAEISVPTTFDSEADVLAWLGEQVARYGETRPVAPLNPADHTSIDPIAELRMKAPDLPISTVGVPGEEPTS